MDLVSEDVGVGAGARTAAERIRFGNHRGRIDLAEALPLSYPLSLMIDPSSACNLRCHFCPTGQKRPTATGKVKLLDVNTFKAILVSLKRFDAPLKSLHLYKDGEPLINKNLGTFVRLAREAGIARSIEITTNGTLMTAEKAQELIEAGIDAVRFSIYGVDDATYLETARRPVSFDDVVAKVRGFTEIKQRLGAPVHVHVKIIDTDLTDDQKTGFLRSFDPVADSVYIEPLFGKSNSNADAANGFEVVSKKARIACSEPFLKMAVRVNGEVSACCADFRSQDTVVGNVHEQCLFDIWHGDKMRDLRRLMLTGGRWKLEACARCSYVKGLPPQNDIDQARERILARLDAE